LPQFEDQLLKKLIEIDKKEKAEKEKAEREGPKRIFMKFNTE
jgi:hypothetical protein